MIRTLLKPLSFLPALMLMYMIYSFSAQPGEVSSQMSYKVSYKIVQTADYIFDGGHEDWQIAQWADKINFITRKLAHMTEYFALAVAVSFPLYVYGLHGILLMLVAGIICVGFACGDEYHQSFVAGRSPAVKDVCIDSVGVFFGIILVRIIGWTGRKTIFRSRPKKQKAKKQSPWSGRKQKDSQEYADGIPNGYSGYGNAPYPAPGRDYPPQYGYGYGPQGGPPPEHAPYGAQGAYTPGGYPPGNTPYNPQGRYPQGNASYNASGEYPQGNDPYRASGEYPQGNDPYNTSGECPQGSASYNAPGNYPPEGAPYGSPGAYPPEGAPYGSSGEYPPEGAPYGSPGEYSPEDSYAPYGYPPQNGYIPYGEDPAQASAGKKKKKEKDWLFDDFV